MGGGFWDVVLSWPNQAVEPGQEFPNSSGVIVGLHHSDWSPYDKQDDPSHQTATSPQLNGKVQVLNASGDVLAGAFPAGASPGTPRFVVAAREEATNESNVSRIRLVARNVGDGATDSLRLQYHFASEGAKIPKLEVYDAAGAAVTLHKVTGRNWRVEVDYSGKRIRPGQKPSSNGVLFALHYPDWSAWDKTNDHSNPKSPAFAVALRVVSRTERDLRSGVAPTLAEISRNSSVPANPTVTAMVAASEGASYLLKPDGTVWGWGYVNQFSRFATASRYGGRFGGTIQEYPVQVSELTDIRQITASGDHLLAVDGSGIVWAIGSTGKAQVLAARADADQMATGTCDRPCPIGGLSGITSISTGGWSRNIALDGSGDVYQWGMPTNQNEDWVGPPVKIGVSGITEIRSCESVSMARSTGGDVYAWNLVSDAPVKVASGIGQLACDDPSHGGLLLTGNGSLLRLEGPYASIPWSTSAVSGLPEFASLQNQGSGWIGKTLGGDIDVWNSDAWIGLPVAPVPMAGFAGAVSIAASHSHAVALLADGTVWAVGQGAFGALGNGSLADATVPVQASITASSDELHLAVQSGNPSQQLVFENNSSAAKNVTFGLTGSVVGKVRLLYTNVSESDVSQIPGGSAVVRSPSLMLPGAAQHAIGGAVDDNSPLAGASASTSAPIAATPSAKEGDSRTWKVYKNTWTENSDGTRSATSTSDPEEQVIGICRKVATQGDRFVYFWVPADQWGDENGMLNQAKIDALSAVIAENETSVYQSVRDVAGEEWGLHGDVTKISEDTKDFHVVLTDLDGDGNPQNGRGDILGYFTSGDSYRKTSYSHSNEALAIYMDSRWLGYSKSTWSATGTYQRIAYSTAAHELQHMIYNYQKVVKGGLSSQETWPNELLSTMIEEVLAKELSWTSAQPSQTRLPYWMENSNKSFTVWADGTTDSYEAVYAFGAMVFRNNQPTCEIPTGSNACDGNSGNWFHGIYRSSRDGFGAIEDAFHRPGQRGYREWLRLAGVNLATATPPDGFGFPSWSIAGRRMDPLYPWTGFTTKPTIATTLPATLEPFAVVPVEVDMPVGGKLSLSVPANTWVTLVPNF